MHLNSIRRLEDIDDIKAKKKNLKSNSELSAKVYEQAQQQQQGQEEQGSQDKHC